MNKWLLLQKFVESIATSTKEMDDQIDFKQSDSCQQKLFKKLVKLKPLKKKNSNISSRQLKEAIKD